MLLKPLQIAELLGALRKVDKAKFDTYSEVKQIGKMSKKLSEMIQELGDVEVKLKTLKNEINTKYKKSVDVASKLEDAEEKKKGLQDAMDELNRELEEHNVEQLQKDFEKEANEDLSIELDKNDMDLLKKYIENNYKSITLSPEFIVMLIEKTEV